MAKLVIIENRFKLNLINKVLYSINEIFNKNSIINLFINFCIMQQN